MLSEELFINLKQNIEKYKEYLLEHKGNATEDDKKLFGVMMFKYGTLLAAKDSYENLPINDKLEVDLIIADAKAFMSVVKEMC